MDGVGEGAIAFCQASNTIALPSSPCLPELMGVRKGAIALPSSPCLPELLGVGEDAIACLSKQAVVYNRKFPYAGSMADG
jgi:hypothetical protein